MAETFIEAVSGNSKAEREEVALVVEQPSLWFGHSVERDRSGGSFFLPVGSVLIKPAQFWEAQLTEIESSIGFADRRRQETQREYDRDDRKRSERKREVTRDSRRVDERIQAEKKVNTKHHSVAMVLSRAEVRGAAPLFEPSSSTD